MAGLPVSWSYERLLQLAPDAGTLEQARRLFFAKRWRLLEGNGEYLWGEYETAYGQLYQAVVRLDPPIFRCSCNSRKHPCKHALALVLLFLNRNEVWRVSEEPPEWVKKSLEPSSLSPEKTTNPAPDLAKQEKRIQLMDSGVAELDKWLQTLARLGLAQVLNAPEEWEILAARMVDCKLGSIARRVRYCHQLIQQDDWAEPLAGEIGLLYLFVRAWQRKEQLEPDQKRELLQVAGWNIRKDQILQNPGVKDNWLVLGVSTGEEEKLRFRRTWLRGEKTGRYALLLDFAFGNQSFDGIWVTGSVLTGILVFYPGQPALRAVFKSFHSSRAPYEAESPYGKLAELQSAYAQSLGQSPWLTTFPALIENVTPVYLKEADQFLLLDKNNYQVPMQNHDNNWKLLALSGGYPISCFGEYDGANFVPISALSGGRVVLL